MYQRAKQGAHSAQEMQLWCHPSISGQVLHKGAHRAWFKTRESVIHQIQSQAILMHDNVVEIFVRCLIMAILLSILATNTTRTLGGGHVTWEGSNMICGAFPRWPWWLSKAFRFTHSFLEELSLAKKGLLCGEGSWLSLLKCGFCSTYQ